MKHKRIVNTHPSARGLCGKLHAQSRTDSCHGIETQLRIGTQRLIRRRARQARGTGDIAQRCHQQRRIVMRQHGSDIFRDGRIATVARSDAWYDDRSRVASLWQQATTGNTTHLSGRGIDPQATLLNVDDRAHNASLTVRASTADGGGERNSYLRFARNDGDLLAGDGLADHLFGGAGDGQIDTQRILTMHPTDFYHSAYRMSSSNDPWRQAA